jgi:hypothetical protein
MEGPGREDRVREVVRNLKPDDAALMGAPADTISAAAAAAAALVFSLSPAACAPPAPPPPPPLFFRRGMTWREGVRGIFEFVGAGRRHREGRPPGCAVARRWLGSNQARTCSCRARKVCLYLTCGRSSEPACFSAPSSDGIERTMRAMGLIIAVESARNASLVMGADFSCMPIHREQACLPTCACCGSVSCK